MERNKKKITAVSVLLAIIVVTGFWIIKNTQKELSKSSDLTAENGLRIAEGKNFALVQVGDIVERVQFESGNVFQSEKLERGDLNEFRGLQDGYWNGNVDDFKILQSVDGKKIIVSKNTEKPLEKTTASEYLCDIESVSCAPTDALSGPYIGLADVNDRPIFWTGWDSKKSRLFGYYSNDEGTRGALYSCDMQEKKCTGSGEEDIRVPEGSFDRLSMRFIVIAQNDKPAQQVTGSNWEARIYASDDLSVPIKKIDISAAIDHSEEVIYDAVNSVAWSSDGKKIAIGTIGGIFLLDMDSEKLEKIYSDNPESDEDDYWNSDALVFSSNGRYVAFIDVFQEQVGDDTEEEIMANDINVLKVIDLENDNKMNELLEAEDMLLKS